MTTQILSQQHLDAAKLAWQCYGESFNYGTQVDAKNIRAFYHQGPDRDKIILPGTNDLKDWFMHNLVFVYDLGYIARHNVKLHRGFCRAANLLVNRLDTLKLLPEDREKPIDIIGHSLGSAAGSVVQVKLNQLGYSLGDFYSFGGPRWSCPDGAMWHLDQGLAENYWRITTVGDPVTRVVPSEFMGVRMADHVWAGGNGSKTIILGADSIGTGPDAWQQGRRGYRLIGPIMDKFDQLIGNHMMGTYYELIERAVKPLS